MPIVIFTSQCSFLTTYNLEFCCFFSPPFLNFNPIVMPKYHGYRIQVGLLPNIFTSSPLMCYYSPLIAHRWQDNTPLVGVTSISYLRFGVIINIVSKEDNSYYVTITNIPHFTCPDLTREISSDFGKERK